MWRFLTGSKVVVIAGLVLASAAVAASPVLVLGSHSLEPWAFSMLLLLQFAYMWWCVLYDRKRRKQTAKSKEDMLKALREEEGFSQEELEIVGSFFDGLSEAGPEFGPIILEDIKHIGKDDMMAFMVDCNNAFPKETWKYKLGVVGVLLLAFALTVTAVLTWR